MKNKFKIWLAWLGVALCTLAIFFIVPLARTIQRFVSERWGRELFGYTVMACAGVAFISALYFLIFKLKIRSIASYAWLTAVVCAYVYFTLKLWQSPEEAVHFLEYGLLGYFLFNALRFRIKDKTIYTAAFLLGCLVGIFDEILQWAVPERFWDFRDVGLNALSSGLFQVALWMGIKPRIISERIRPRSIRTVSILVAVNILLLGLCFSNTPKRVQSYTRTFPFLSFLQKEEAMNQFNLKHRDPDIGIFYSRLTLEALEIIDKDNAQGYGQILRDWQDKDYSRFLRTYTGIWQPFLHEFRVHTYRRDKRYERAGQTEDQDTKGKNFFIAYKENLILEKYFGRTLKESPYFWGDETRTRAEALIDKNTPYRSPVSATFFTPKNERQLWIVILILLALLFIVNRILWRADRKG